MNYGIQTARSARGASKSGAYILFTLAIPYLNGAYLQVERYKSAAAELASDNAATTVGVCLHEASCLFEDLCMVSKYVTELCKHSNGLHQTWLDVRNHIRHDFRENFDKPDTRSNSRGERLNLSQNLRSSVGFDRGEIKIGGTTVTLESVIGYLDWASDIIGCEIDRAKKAGLIKLE